jgi:hypothetical protein
LQKRSSIGYLPQAVEDKVFLRICAAMLHRLFSAATSAAARKGKSLAVEEEEIAKSKQLLYGYICFYSRLNIDIYPRRQVILWVTRVC